MKAIGPKFLANDRPRPGIMARRALGEEMRNNYPLVGQVFSEPAAVVSANGPMAATLSANGPIAATLSANGPMATTTIRYKYPMALMPKSAKPKYTRTPSPLTKTRRRHRRNASRRSKN